MSAPRDRSGISPDPAPSRVVEAPPRVDGLAAEKIVVAILALMACILGYLRFGFLPRSTAAESLPFDLRNPLLDARVGECVEVEDSSQPGAVTCVSVAEPGVVIRPHLGPEKIGIYEDLRRASPYVVCGLSWGPCATEGRKREDWLVYDLNGFGMPSRIHVELLQVTPTWRSWSGRTHHTYEVQTLRHGQYSGPNVLWISDDAPITGVIYRQYSYGRVASRDAVYREVPGCAD